jgi:hypothetical protein
MELPVPFEKGLVPYQIGPSGCLVVDYDRLAGINLRESKL